MGTRRRRTLLEISSPPEGYRTREGRGRETSGTERGEQGTCQRNDERGEVICR